MDNCINYPHGSDFVYKIIPYFTCDLCSIYDVNIKKDTCKEFIKEFIEEL